MYILSVLHKAPIEFSLRPTEWVLLDWLFCPCFPVLCHCLFLYVCVCLICPKDDEEVRKGKGVYSWVCWHVGLLTSGGLDDTLQSIVQCYVFRLHLSSVPMTYCKKKVHTFTNCVAQWHYCSPNFCWWEQSKVVVIYSCTYMITSNCNGDCRHYFLFLRFYNC